MVAIVSGARTGLELGTLATLGAAGLNGQAVEGRNRQGVYVDVANGNVVVQQQDDRLVARGDDAVLLRTYNSRGMVDDDPDNWMTGVEVLRLTGALNTPGSTITRIGRDGSAAQYSFDTATASYVTTEGDGAYDRIRYVTADAQYEWTDGASGTTQRYEGSGALRLLSCRDASGNALAYAYGTNGFLASVSTSAGETLFYDYTAGNLTQVRAVTGGVTTTRVGYAYDASSRLVAVTVDLSPSDNATADGNVYRTNYTYDGTSKRLARITQTDGNSLSFTYVDAGAGVFLVSSVTDALNQVTAFSYTLGAPGLATSTVVTDARGQATRYDFDAGGQVTSITAPMVNGATPRQQFTYNARGDVTALIDGEGRSTVFEYDANGNQVLQRDGAGNTVTRTFDARNQLVTETRYIVADPDGAGVALPSGGLTSRYVYDAGGRNQLRFTLSPEGKVTEYRYDGFGQRVATIRYELAYPVGPLPATTVPTEASMAAWAAAGAQASQRQDLAYDARGQLQTRTTYARLNAAGDGLADGSQSVERFVYDAAGLLLQTVSAVNGTSTNTYDGLGRVLASTNALGQATLTRYSDAGRATTLTLANGLVVTQTFDAAGRLVSSLESSGASNLGETRFAYDSQGRLVMTTDATGVRSFVLYDVAGRKTADIDGNGTLTEYRYDASGLLVASTEWGTAVTTGLVDANGVPLNPSVAAIRPAASANDQTVWNQYDTAGRLVRTAQQIGTGARAAVTETRYDGLSRVLQVVRYATTVPADGSAGSAAAGSVSLPAAAADDRVTRYFYDGDGHLAATLDAEGYIVAYQYNAAGQVAEKVAYATATAAALRASGSLAQLVPAPSGADKHEATLYDAHGQIVGSVDAEGFLTESVYDAAGRSTLVVRYATRVTGTVTVGSSVAAWRPAVNSADRATSRSYDLLGRLVQETSPENVVTQYAYDDAGKLVSTTRAAGTIEQRMLLARYDVQGRLVGELTGEGAALLTGGQTQAQVDAVWAQYGLQHTYDAAGRRTSTRDALGNTTWFYYDADGALRYTINALGEVRENRYDERGRIVQQVAYATRVATRGPGGLLTSSLTLTSSAQDAVSTTSYTREGRAVTATDAEGNITAHAYNSFGDEVGSTRAISAGVSLAETYAVDRLGQRVGRTSDAAGANVIVSTTYDAFGRVTRTVDGMGNARDTTYDRLGRMVTTRDPMGGTRSTSYDAFDRVLTETNALGAVTTYAYDKAARSLCVTTAEGIRTTTVRNRHGEVQSITDGNGNVTSYSYDRNGRLLNTTTPLTVTSTRYDNAGQVIETTDANGNKVAYSFDAAGRVLTRRVDPTGLNLTTTYTYDGRGQQVTVTDANGVPTSYQYDRNGRTVRKTVDPSGLNLQTVYSHDANGNVLTVTSPGGTVTQYVYDALGRRVQERVDPAGLNLVRGWGYDKNGNVTSSTDGRGSVTRYVFDAGDRLVFTVDPSGGVRQTIYDAGGRVVKTIAFATSINTVGLPAQPSAAQVQARISPQASADVVEHRVYDRDDRVAATIDGMGGVVRFTYDGNGNVVTRVAFATSISLASWTPGTVPAPTADPAHDARLDTIYDALDRAIYTMDGIGAVVAQRFDGNGQLLERTAYAATVPITTAVTTAALTAAVAAIAAPARDAVIRHTYDAAGRRTWSVDGTGAVNRLQYDAAGNIVQKTSFATALASGVTANSVAPSAADRVVSWAYDAAGRLVFEVDPLNAVTERALDADGHVLRQTTYAKALLTLPVIGTSGTVAALRAALQATPSTDRSTRAAFDGAGRKEFEVGPEGGATEFRYDGAGNLLQRTAYARALDPNALGANTTSASLRLLVTASSADRVTRYVYDAAGRLVTETDAVGTDRATQYDGVGRIVFQGPQGRGETFSYDAASHRSTTADALGFVERRTFDALGNVLTFTNKKGDIWTYEYDAAGRQVREMSPQVLIKDWYRTGFLNLTWAVRYSMLQIRTEMRYDALGNLLQRGEAVGRRLEERWTSYEYDAAGRQVRVIYPQVGVYAASRDVPLDFGSTGVSARVEDLKSLETRTIYDVLGNAVANIDVGGGLSQKAYDKAGGLTYEVDALGFVTRYDRDAFGAVKALTRFANRTTLASRSVTQASQAASKGEVDQAVYALGVNHAMDRTVLSFYDRAGRLTEVHQPDVFVNDSSQGGFTGHARTRTSYDAFGDAIQVSTSRDVNGSAWFSTVHYFDQIGREIGSVDALGYLTGRGYDAFGNLTKVTEYATALAAGSWSAGAAPPADPLLSADDRVTSYAYDSLNRKVKETQEKVAYSAAPDGTSQVGDLVTSYEYDALGNQTRTTNARGFVTQTAYNAMGWVSSVLGPREISSTGAEVPYTEFYRDGLGNVVRQIDYAHGVTLNAGIPSALAGADDRTTYTDYDLLGHAISRTDGNGALSFTSYDAFGHAAKNWRGVTSIDGITQTSFEIDTYDAVGQLVQTTTPRSASAVTSTLNAVYSPFIDGGEYAPSQPNKLSLAWGPTFVDANAGVVRVEADVGNPDYPVTYSQEYAAGSVLGGVDMSFMGWTSNLVRFRVLQKVGTLWVTRWQGTLADAKPAVSGITQAAAGVMLTNQEFNAFGEITRKGTEGGRQEYFDYDNAGQVWRTNTGDGVDKIQLYDLQGNVTAEIRSGGSGGGNENLKNLQSPSDAQWNTGLRRTDMEYDALGRMTRRLEPKRVEVQGAVNFIRQSTTATILRSQVYADEYGGGYVENSVRLLWSTSLSGVGSGDIRIHLEYQTPITQYGGYYDEYGWVPVQYSVPQSGSYVSGPLDGGQWATSGTLVWTDRSSLKQIGTITRIWVEKRDLNSEWKTVLDQRPGWGRSELDVTAPVDTKYTSVTLKLRKAGIDEFLPYALDSFGDRYRYDVSQLAPGAYDYQVLVQDPDDGSGRVVSSGSFNVTLPPLSSISGVVYGQAGTGIVSWSAPARTETQAFRYRLAGANAWTVRDIKSYNTTVLRDGVDLNGLATGTYEFELLWTSPATGVPYAHATGAFSVVQSAFGGSSLFSLNVSTAANSSATSTLAGAFAAGIQNPGTGDTAQPIVEQTFDRWGNVLQVTDPRNRAWKTAYAYNAWNKVISQRQVDVDGGGVPLTSIYYDALGRQMAVKDARGNVNGQVYDARGNVVEERHADTGVVQNTYNALGQKVSSVDAMGRATTRYTYDHIGNLLQTFKGDARVYTVDANNSVIDQGMKTLVDTSVYDQLGRRISFSRGDSSAPTKYYYDLAGNLIASEQAGGSKWRAAYDAQGRKIAEWDGGVASSYWTYDYFGHLTAHTDLGGARYTYTYDNAQQLIRQTNTRGQSLAYGYDLAGQLVQITDTGGYAFGSSKVTTYAYDLSGRKIREKVQVGSLVYQDNHLAYDALGNLRDVADARVHLTLEYDKAGNRTLIGTTYKYTGLNGEVGKSTARYFKYDEMNRQIVVDAIDATYALGEAGHAIKYDKNGNRTEDKFWAADRVEKSVQTVTTWDEYGPIYTQVDKYENKPGLVTETYSYDALNRLQTVTRDNWTLDSRAYDAADRVVRSGAPGLPAGYTTALGNTTAYDTKISRYAANGRLLHQKLLSPTGTVKADISWDPTEAGSAYPYNPEGYDGAGNVRSYVVKDYAANATTKYSTDVGRFERYVDLKTSGLSTRFQPGSLTQGYDVNGNLVSVTDATQSLNNRSFVNDVEGKALYVTQGGNVQRQLIVNGEVLGIYGVGVNRDKPTAAGGSPAFAELADFNFSYAPISSKYPSATPGAYQTRTGDTLQSIARSAYGDSSLWYLIADANGLRGKEDLKVGQVLNIPGRVSTVHNNGGTFTPYDPSRITGDLTPNMPLPAPANHGCGGVGQLLMVIVAVVVTIYTAGAMAGVTSTFAETMAAGGSVMAGTGSVAGGVGASIGVAGTAAVSAGVGSIAGQLVGMATGTIDKFSWKGVALSALGGGAGAAMGGLGIGSAVQKATESAFLGAAAQAAAANVISQGIGVATGLQQRFDWRGVAASAVGAGISKELGQTLSTSFGGKPLGDLAARAISGLIAGASVAAMRGGKVAVQQIAVDAFGNALGQSIAENANGIAPAANRQFPDADNTYDAPYKQAAGQAEFVSAMNRLGAGGIDDYPSVQVVDAGDRLDVDRDRMDDLDRQIRDATNVLNMLNRKSSAGANVAATAKVIASGAADVRTLGEVPIIPHPYTPFEADYPAAPALAVVPTAEAAQVNVPATPGFQEANDQKVTAGNYDRFNEMGNAWSGGRYGDFFRHFLYDSSDTAKQALAQRNVPAPLNPNAVRINNMLASPIGAAASVIGRGFGASQHTQDALLATFGWGEQVAGAVTGIYKQTLTAQAPIPSVNASKLRGGPLGPHPVADASNYAALFRKARPDLPRDWQVHHSMPQRYRELMGTAGINIHETQFLRGVPQPIHSKVTTEWERFHRGAGGDPTAAQVADFAKVVDKRYGGHFMWPGF